jgi:hypothetical protein
MHPLPSSALSGVIEATGNRSPRGERHDGQEPQQKRLARKTGSVEYPMIGVKMALTVRWPGAKMAPVMSILTCGQTGAENPGAKVAIRRRNG